MHQSVVRSIPRSERGLRRVGFERRVTIFFVVAEDSVSILRIFYAGRDWQAYLDELAG
jgi:plasmid stabilization system protein ParE